MDTSVSEGKCKEETRTISAECHSPHLINPMSCLAGGEQYGWLVSGQMGFNANLSSVSSFPGFLAETHHSLVLEDSHTPLRLFYFTPRSAQSTMKARRGDLRSAHCQWYIVLAVVSVWCLQFYPRIIQDGNKGRFTCLNTGQMTVRKHMCSSFFTCILFLAKISWKAF